MSSEPEYMTHAQARAHRQQIEKEKIVALAHELWAIAQTPTESLGIDGVVELMAPVIQSTFDSMKSDFLRGSIIR